MIRPDVSTKSGVEIKAATAIDRSVTRSRRIIIAFAAFLIVEGTAYVIRSDNGRWHAFRLVAAARGYDGCICEQCRDRILGVGATWETVVAGADLVSIPVEVLTIPTNGSFDNWVAGRNMLLLALPVLSFGALGRRAVRHAAIRLAPDPFACVGCGYDLRGLSEASGCPECGKAR